MTTALAAGRATPDEVFDVPDKLWHWAREKGASEATTQLVVNCLQEDFLLSLSEPKSKHYWKLEPGTKNWRYLCCRHIGRLLGWTEQYPKGDI